MFRGCSKLMNPRQERLRGLAMPRRRRCSHFRSVPRAKSRRFLQHPLAILKVIGLFVASLQFVPRRFHSLAMIFLAARLGSRLSLALPGIAGDSGLDAERLDQILLRLARVGGIAAEEENMQPVLSRCKGLERSRHVVDCQALSRREAALPRERQSASG